MTDEKQIKEYWLKDVGYKFAAEELGIDVGIVKIYYDKFNLENKKERKKKPLTEDKMRTNYKPWPARVPVPVPTPVVAFDEITPLTKREAQWYEFSNAVAEHLRLYTVPQYGDVGQDEITNYTVQDCVTHLQRYAKRYGTQSREGQQKLDFMKIAHYAQCAWEKYEEPLKPHEKGEYNLRVFYVRLIDKPDFEYMGMAKDQNGKTIYIYREILTHANGI